MNKVNRITICRDEYDSEYEFHETIKKAITLLLETRYVMVVRYDEPGLGIVTIDFEHDDTQYGCPYPYWLTADQAFDITTEENTYEN